MPADRSVRIDSHQDLGASHFLLTLSADEAIPHWDPGQFAMISLGLPDASSDPLLRRPFSIYNLSGTPSQGDHGIQIFYKVLGQGTALLSRARAGGSIRCLAPLGNGFAPDRRPGTRLLLVAGGIGAASLHPLALQESKTGGQPLMLYGCRAKADLVGVKPTIASGIEVRFATDDGSAGHHGFVSDLLDGLLRDEGPSARERWVICACGPTPMMRATAEVAARHSVPCHVSLESPMACGFGVCVGCAVGTREGPDAPLRYQRICVDGPVFDARKVCW